MRKTHYQRKHNISNNCTCVSTIRDGFSSP